MRVPLQAAPGNASSTIDFGASVQNLDQSDLTVKILAAPSIGSLRVGGASDNPNGSDSRDRV